MIRILKTLLPSLIIRRYIRALFKKIVQPINRYYENVTIRNTHKLHTKNLKRLREKEKYKVAFFMIFPSNWKYDTVYQLLEKSPFFDPIVIIIPSISWFKNALVEEMEKSEKFCVSMNYNYAITWCQKSNKWIDVKELIKPDIVFFTNPYFLTKKIYYITHFKKCLTCYVPYSIRQETIYKTKFDTYFQNIVWRNYYESTIHLQLAEKYARNKGSNVRVTGYPAIDDIKFANSDKFIWKEQSIEKKKIIWAPHWTIPGIQKTSLDWSCFLIFSEFMLDLAADMENEVQFSFKPHPLLKHVLARSGIWDKAKIKNYYQRWCDLPNGQLDESGYASLFSSSDALIHDSGSFMIEYLAVNKPVLYLHNVEDVAVRFNEYGKLAYDCHYKAYNEQDIRHFIAHTVLRNVDELKTKRENFGNKVLLLNDQSSSQKIVNDILLNLYKI